MLKKDAISEHYDFLLPFYRLVWGEHIHHGLFLRGDESPKQAQEQMIAHCAERGGIARGASVLDVGCGLGATAIYLAQRWGCNVRGITISPKQARRARKNAERAGVLHQVEIICGDAEALDLPEAAYDVVWTMESSEHFADRAAYFRKAARALKPGGALVVAAWTGDPASERVRKVARWGLCAGIQTAQQYAEQIAAAGLELRAQEDLTAQVARTWEICTRRARWLWPVKQVLPRRHREFADGMRTILEAYWSGELSYTTIFAKKRG
jgi:tocopherol O-methyltransferase